MNNITAKETVDAAEKYLASNAIPPTYAPPRPPPTGKPLTTRQKIMLAATILAIIVLVAVAMRLVFK
jgi:hypothetical protein